MKSQSSIEEYKQEAVSYNDVNHGDDEFDSDSINLSAIMPQDNDQSCLSKISTNGQNTYQER